MNYYGVYDMRLTDNNLDIFLFDTLEQAEKKADMIFAHLTPVERKKRDLHIGLYEVDNDGNESEQKTIKQY